MELKTIIRIASVVVGGAALVKLAAVSLPAVVVAAVAAVAHYYAGEIAEKFGR